MRAGARQFRRLVEEHFGGRPGRGCRYPAALRGEAVWLARGALSEGLSLARVADQLGVRESTLSRWLDGSSERPSLRPVEVVAGEAEPAGRGPGSGVVVVTASGVRIEGLRVEEVPALVRELARIRHTRAQERLLIVV